MSLHLDARQRAMLQEMGVTVWVQPEAPVARTTAGAPAVAVAAPAPAARMAPPTGLGGGSLNAADSLTRGEPLRGDAGRLLANMLRAMQLHKHPRVFLAALERTAAGAETGGDSNIPVAL